LRLDLGQLDINPRELDCVDVYIDGNKVDPDKVRNMPLHELLETQLACNHAANDFHSDAGVCVFEDTQGVASMAASLMKAFHAARGSFPRGRHPRLASSTKRDVSVRLSLGRALGCVMAGGYGTVHANELVRFLRGNLVSRMELHHDKSMGYHLMRSSEHRGMITLFGDAEELLTDLQSLTRLPNVGPANLRITHPTESDFHAFGAGADEILFDIKNNALYALMWKPDCRDFRRGGLKQIYGVMAILRELLNGHGLQKAKIFRVIS